LVVVEEGKKKKEGYGGDGLELRLRLMVHGCDEVPAWWLSSTTL